MYNDQIIICKKELYNYRYYNDTLLANINEIFIIIQIVIDEGEYEYKLINDNKNYFIDSKELSEHFETLAERRVRIIKEII